VPLLLHVHTFWFPQPLQELVEVLKDMPDKCAAAEPALRKIFHVILMPFGPELAIRYAFKISTVTSCTQVILAVKNNLRVLERSCPSSVVPRVCHAGSEEPRWHYLELVNLFILKTTNVCIPHHDAVWHSQQLLDSASPLQLYCSAREAHAKCGICVCRPRIARTY
jgi:hypothetical protein